VPARIRIEWRDADQTMHAAFRLQSAIGVGAVDPDRRRFYPGFLAAALFDPLDLVIVRLRPADVPDGALGRRELQS
jgi:hypothetical protein